VVLVDVPGLGSVHRHNTETALAAFPEADAALFVVSVDPPLGQAELDQLATVSGHAARVDVVDRQAQGAGRTEEARRRTLRELQGALRRIEEGA
jgi:hypothetical protein